MRVKHELGELKIDCTFSQKTKKPSRVFKNMVDSMRIEKFPNNVKDATAIQF